MKTRTTWLTYLKKIQELTLAQGWAVSKPNTEEFLRPINAWGFPKYPDRTVILPPVIDFGLALEAFIRANTAQLEEPDCWLGTWQHPRTGDIYLDVTTSCAQLSEALELTARSNAVSKRKIIAVYNSQLDKTVYL